MWSYDRLWKLLIDKKLKKTNLIELAHIHANTLARMSKNEPVSMEALGKLCTALGCRIEDIVTFIPDQKE
jgi:putative transcriptional regulator